MRAELPKLGTAEVLHGNALDLPLEDESVDLIISSPPYFALRSYQDEGEHYEGQIGSEETPEQFLEALWAVMAECWRVLKPTGSCWINLGDKYAGSAGWANGTAAEASSTLGGRKQQRVNTEPPKAPVSAMRPKSLMAMPWRFAIGCIDGKAAPEAQQWILRAEVIWSKPNGLPESVTDRVRRSHEQWFHFTKQGKYFSGIDEIREPHAAVSLQRAMPHRADVKAHEDRHTVDMTKACHPLGKLPGSVWSVPSEPLKVPEELGIDHFAAFPTEWPRRIILGWSPSGVCVECGEGRQPVSERTITGDRGGRQFNVLTPDSTTSNLGTEGFATITGYACACAAPTADTRPARILDPFGGTGTVAMVAKALGREGISVDLSKDYCRLAEWRTTDPQEIRDVQAKTYGIKREVPQQIKGQAALFGDD